MCPQIVEPQPKTPASPALVAVDGRVYPLRSAQVHARAEGGLALTTLIQEFENPHDEPLEVIYTVPLPADGAVLGYQIRMGERVIRGEIEKRDIAEADYKKALFEGRTAGLLEQNRADTFEQRLGNLPAHTNARIEIEVLHALAFLLGGEASAPIWEYRFPTVVGVRYEGEPGHVTDAAKLDVDRGDDGGIPTRVALDVEIADEIADATGSTAAITSPSHEIKCVAGANVTHVHLAEHARLDRDLIIQWSAVARDVGVRIVEGRGLTGDDGRYALVTVTPAADPAVVYHRDVTVLIDASGSMSGPPLEAAKRVVADLLASLAAGDRFEVFAFASTVEPLSARLSNATPRAVRKCLAKLAALRAGGATEMMAAVTEAMVSLRPETQRQIVLVTDGYIGFEREIVHKLAAELPAGVRVHAVGIGAAPNRSLTSGVARAGRGHEFFANDERTAARVSRRLCAATVRPVLTELMIGGSAVVASAPALPRDVFAEKPLVMAVELRPAGGTLDVTGQLAGKKGTWAWRVNIDSAFAGATALPLGAYYGRERIADLEAGVVKPERSAHRPLADGLAPEGGPDLGLDQAVEALGLRHRVVSRRTSLIAIAEEAAVDPRAPRRRERIAVEMPYGVSPAGAGVGVLHSLLGAARFRGSAPRRYGSAGSAFGGATPASPPPTGSAGGIRVRGTPQLPVLEIFASNAVRFANDTVIIEFTVPHDGFLLPDGVVRLIGALGDSGNAEVNRSESSRVGPHRQGLIVRMALRVADDAFWASSISFRVEWTAKRPDPLSSANGIGYRVQFKTPLIGAR
ncbi:MAG: VIT domain-containing protein [Planctomycetota bacterium]